MGEHTPGPWYIRGAADGSAYWHVGPDGAVPVTGARSEADARLIAAAPDQHDALKEIRAVAARTKGTPDLTEAAAMLDHIEGIARRAIAGAGGSGNPDTSGGSDG